MASSQYTFFGDHIALEALTQAGDRLVELDRHVDMQSLVAVADGIWRQSATPAKGPGGRKPWSSEVMMRVLLLKRLYNLSDEQTEFQLRDRLSFLRFVRLGLGDEVPDSRTIWLYGEMLSQADGARKLFDAFNQQLLAQGLILKEGIMVDATMVEVPRQRNSREENALIKQGETPSDWKKQPRKSSIRARVEHPFAFMEQSLGGIYNRCIGIIRNNHQIGMMNLAYNLCRSVQLVRVTA